MRATVIMECSTCFLNGYSVQIGPFFPFSRSSFLSDCVLACAFSSLGVFMDAESGDPGLSASSITTADDDAWRWGISSDSVTAIFLRTKRRMFPFKS